MWFETCEQKGHSYGSSVCWPTWTVGIGLNSMVLYSLVGTVSVPLILEMVWFCSTTMSVCTLYGTLDTCAAFRLGNFGPPSIRFEFGPQRFSSVSNVKGAVFRTSFHLRWRRQTCYHHVADVTGPYLLCFRDGQTSQALWHMLQPAREGRFKTEYQWRLRCVLSVSYIKTLPLTYGYCTLAFWSIFLHRLYVYNHFQNVHYSTTQAIHDLAQTRLAVQSN